MSTYIKPYSRSMRHTDLVEGGGKARDALHNVIQSMFAITNLMRALLVEGEDRQDLAEGVYHLLDQQCAMLNGVFEELGEEERRREGAASGRVWTDAAMTDAAEKLRRELIEAGAKSGADTLSIAAAMNIPTGVIEGVVNQLRGSKQPSGAGRAARA